MNNTAKHKIFNIRYDFLICLFLVIAILAVYWQVRNYSFVNYDDPQYVTKNHNVQAGLTLESITWSFTAVQTGNWHPLTWISHMLDCQLYGMNPGRHHLTNVLLHILNSLLLFLVFMRMTGKLWQSGFVAALFALHPLHVESVAWIAERKDVLSTFFWMLSLWGYLRYVERPGACRYLLLLLLFILGLMTKPMLVTLPFVLLLLDYWPLNRFQSGSSGDGNHSVQRPSDFGLLWEKIPLFFLSAVSSVVTYLVQKSGGAVKSLAVIPFHDRIANAIISYGSYMGKMIWPDNLAVFYPYPKSILWWKVAGAGLLLVVVSVVIFRMVRTKPYLAVGWLWYIGTLVPVIGLVQVGSQGMADRYTYVPLIGIFVIIAWGVPDFMPKWRYRRIGFTVTIAAIIAIIMITTRLQIRYWSNSVTLFEHALEVTGDNGIVHAKLGEAFEEQGKIDAAVRHYREALLINPDFVEPLLNLGVALKEKGELNEAINCFSKVLRTNSNHADAHYELGDTLKRKGDFAGATKHYLEAIRIKPDRAKTYNNLGVVLVLQNKGKEAIIRFYEALRIDPAYAGAYYNLGKVFARQGKTESAILHFQKALQKNPDMTQALYNLSWIEATSEDDKFRNGIEAIKLAEKLCKLQNYSQPLSLDALAAAYAEAGRFKEAVLTAQKGLELALKMGSKELAPGLENRLKLYHAGRPYRQK